MSRLLKHCSVLLSLFGGLLNCEPHAAADIILIGDSTAAFVNRPSIGDAVSQLQNSGTGTTASASLTGMDSTTTSLFSNSVFTADFSQSRTGENNDYAFGLVLAVFQVTTPTSYTISGSYTNSSSTTGLDVGLWYEPSGIYL